MMRYYTVDRSNALTPGDTLSGDFDFASCRFFPVIDHFSRSDLTQFTEQLFPEGLTKHGKKYLLDESLQITNTQGVPTCIQHNPIVELVFELVRRVSFDSSPSRLTSIFAWRTLDDAFSFQQQHGGGTILEVEAGTAFQGDMNLLYLGNSSIGAWLFAYKYWKGESGPSPRWEYLLVPPVRIICVVT